MCCNNTESKKRPISKRILTCGTRLQHTAGTEYIVARLNGPKEDPFCSVVFNLISLDAGNRWSDDYPTLELLEKSLHKKEWKKLK